MHGSAAPRLLGLRLKSRRRHGCLSVCCECCVLSGRGLCVDLITHPEESYRVWCVELSVIVKPRQRGAPGAFGTAAPMGVKLSTQNRLILSYTSTFPRSLMAWWLIRIEYLYFYAVCNEFIRNADEAEAQNQGDKVVCNALSAGPL